MIVTLTDFGHCGPYLGQVHAAIELHAPGTRVIDLFSDAPVHDPRASAYLLAAYYAAFPTGSVFLCVVDPGVGTFQHQPVCIQADRRWFVGPDNGLFNTLKVHHPGYRLWPLPYAPERLSASFHGRDLYAPAAAGLVTGEGLRGAGVSGSPVPDWPADLLEVIYIDHFGNAITGLRTGMLGEDAVLRIGDRRYGHARTFAEVPAGQGFWYGNANGLVEIAINQGRATEAHGIGIGQRFEVLPSLCG